MREARIFSPLQRLQLLDAAWCARERVEADDAPDQTPPWISAGMTWREWAAQLDPDSAIVVAPNEAEPDA